MDSFCSLLLVPVISGCGLSSKWCSLSDASQAAPSIQIVSTGSLQEQEAENTVQKFAWISLPASESIATCQYLHALFLRFHIQWYHGLQLSIELPWRGVAMLALALFGLARRGVAWGAVERLGTVWRGDVMVCFVLPNVSWL